MGTYKTLHNFKNNKKAPGQPTTTKTLGEHQHKQNSQENHQTLGKTKQPQLLTVDISHNNIQMHQQLNDNGESQTNQKHPGKTNDTNTNHK